MSLSAPISVAAAPPAPAAVSGPPDYAARVARFDSLAAAAADAAASLDQRVSAYADLQTLQASGGLVGLDADRRQQLDRITYDSDIGQRAQTLSRSYVEAVNTAGRSGGASAALRAAAAQVDSLSASDKAILFAATLNAADRSGARPYADLQAWRENTDAQARMVDYMQQSGAVGPDGRMDYRAAAAKAVSDPQFAKVLRLSQRRDNTSPDWTSAVQGLLGGSVRGPDRLDLSPEARARLAAAPPAAPAPAQPAPYRAGTLVSRTA